MNLTDDINDHERVPRRAVAGVVHGVLMMETVIDGNGRLRFAISTCTALRDEWRMAEEIFVPPHGIESFVEARSLHLPSEAVRGVSAEDLIAEIMAFASEWADPPAEWLEPIAHYVLMTWVYDRFAALPYLRFLGEYGTGKTRMLQVAAVLCYRSLTVSGNITGPALFRTIDLIRGTLAIDEGDFKTSAEWSDIVKVLNNGYTPGFPIIRMEGDAGSLHPRAFHVYGPKVISTRHRFEDAALESRCLTFETQERKIDPRIPLQLSPEFYEEARAMRNKLLGWRFDNFRYIEPDDSMLRHLDPRTGQVGASLIAVAPDKDAIVRFLNGYSTSAKEDSPREVVRQILAQMKGNLSVADVTRTANQRLEGSGLNPLTYRAVGSIVRSLGCRTKRKNSGYVIERG